MKFCRVWSSGSQISFLNPKHLSLSRRSDNDLHVERVCIWCERSLCVCWTVRAYSLFLLTPRYSLEFELSGELVLGLLQFLSAPHVLVVHVLDLRFDALELGIQLRGERERGREREGERSKQSGWGGEMSPGAVCSLMNWSPARWGLVAHSNSTGGTGVGRKGQPIGAWQHSSPPSLRFIPPLSSCAPELPHCSFFDCPGSKQVG